MIHRVEYITDKMIGGVEQHRACATKALILCLNKKGLNIPLDSSRPEIINHHHLKNWPKLLVSISHTSNNGLTIGAAAIHDKEQASSIGIDIEFSDRLVNKNTTKFFINKYDQINDTSLLHIWTFKEAAFKAIAPLLPEITLLNHLWIKKLEFGIVGDSKTLGTVKWKSIKVENKNVILTTAELLNS
jgi:4'-phosphopantetheinyl transferase EntD